MKMSKNVGIMDRIIRFLTGTGLIVAGLTIAKGTLGVIFMILSVPLLLSAPRILSDLYPFGIIHEAAR